MTDDPPRSARPASPAPALTEREYECLELVAVGHTNAEIGRRIYLSEDTVKTHLRRLFAKLGARDRAHAVHLAHLRGLL